MLIFRGSNKPYKPTKTNEVFGPIFKSSNLAVIGAFVRCLFNLQNIMVRIKYVMED